MVNLNLRDFPGSQESAWVVLLSVGCQNPMEPSRETSSSQRYLAHDAARSALANDHCHEQLFYRKISAQP